MTLSIGLAGFPEQAAATEELLRVGGECLYRPKSAGRNRVIMADSPEELPAAPAVAEKQLTKHRWRKDDYIAAADFAIYASNVRVVYTSGAPVLMVIATPSALAISSRVAPP